MPTPAGWTLLPQEIPQYLRNKPPLIPQKSQKNRNRSTRIKKLSKLFQRNSQRHINCPKRAAKPSRPRLLHALDLCDLRGETQQGQQQRHPQLLLSEEPKRQSCGGVPRKPW